MTTYAGQTLGQYHLEALLGTGTLGQVFRGTHPSFGQVAIKVMPPALAANPAFQSRFLQDVKVAAALKHPNIVKIYDFGEQEGSLYLAMEWMPDGSLRTLLQRNAGKPLPLRLGLELVRQAAEGLAAAHAQHVVHGDVKPDNLLLARQSAADQQPERYQLKISDFWQARLAQESGLVATDVPWGTPAYMSPEQCQSKPLDGRSDLYSLGVVLYEVATGYLPFQINTFDEAFDKHVNTPPPSPRKVRPELPPRLEAIILRCLAKRPEERYATGTDLASDLQRVLDELPAIPTITGIAPASGPAAGETIVLITGDGFTGASQILFGELAASSFTVKSKTQITSVSPAGSGTVDVRVTTAEGTSALTTPDQFTYIQPPQPLNRIGVTVEPETLTITPGQPATIQVKLVNLGNTVDWFTPTVEGVAPEWVQGQGQAVQLNPGMQQTISLSVNVARTAANRAQDYSVTIRARSQEQPSESNCVHGSWTVQPFTEDALGLEPRRASGRGSAVYTVTLQNGGNTPSQYELSGEDDEKQLTYSFGQTPVALEAGKDAKVPLQVSAPRRWVGREQRLPFQVHARTAGNRNLSPATGEFVNKVLLPVWLLALVLVVVVAGGGLAFLLPKVTTTPPKVMAIDPTRGPAGGGTTITITGERFNGATKVTFGTAPASNVQVVSDTQIKAVSPAGSNTIYLTVSTPGGTSATSSVTKFTYLPIPTVTSISQSSGPARGGTSVTLTGSDFTDAARVAFGGIPADNVLVINDHTITATSPAGHGIVYVTVTTDGGTSPSSVAKFAYVPMITGINRNYGSAEGGTSIRLTGYGFTDATRVAFGGIPADNVLVINDHTITATSPAGHGIVYVTVTTDGGTSPSSDTKFAYVPQITSISPSSGPAQGGTNVYIYGYGFTGAMRVVFGAKLASFTVNSSTQITAISPAGPSDIYATVMVSTLGGDSNIVSYLYR